MRQAILLIGLLFSRVMLADPPFGTHSPMHPANNQLVTFVGEATGSIDKVRLSYRRAKLTVVNSDGLIQLTVAQPDTELKVCDPPGTKPLVQCDFTMTTPFPASSLVTFTVTATDGLGIKEISEYSFAAGDYPEPRDPIPIRVLNVPARALDVVFIPTQDLPVATLRSKLSGLVEQYIRHSEIKSDFKFHNFYYSSIQGDYAQDCIFTNPSNMVRLQARAELVAFLHTANLRDCFEPTSKRMSSEVDDPNDHKSLVHESGHAFFGLEDEYCCDSGYVPQACVPNLYSSLAACEADAPRVGFPKANCTQLKDASTTLNFWRIDPNTSGGCIMGDAQHTPRATFSKACTLRLQWRYGKCAAGNCMPMTECP